MTTYTVIDPMDICLRDKCSFDETAHVFGVISALHILQTPEDIFLDEIHGNWHNLSLLKNFKESHNDFVF